MFLDKFTAYIIVHELGCVLDVGLGFNIDLRLSKKGADEYFFESDTYL